VLPGEPAFTGWTGGGFPLEERLSNPLKFLIGDGEQGPQGEERPVFQGRSGVQCSRSLELDFRRSPPPAHEFDPGQRDMSKNSHAS
jgi:hypothetical protein